MATTDVEYAFEEGHHALQLRVKMPMTQSMEEIHLEVGHMEVRLFVSDSWHCLALPQHLVQRVSGEAAAKFSRRRKELTIAWPLSPDVIWEEEEPASDGYPSKVKGADWLLEESEAKEALAKTKKEEPAPDSSPSPTSPAEETKAQEAPTASPASPKALQHGFAPAYGSIWNQNSWHWEEKNCMDLATSEVRKTLEENPFWKHVPELEGHGFVIKDLQLKGDASFALRKKKRLLCYELSASFKWEGRDEFGHALGVKGTAQVDGMTPEDEEEPEVTIEITTAARHGGKEAKVAGQWMKGTGARYIAELLMGRSLAPRIVAAEVAQARPEAEEMARRRLEEKKAEDAASAAAKQHRISEEARQRELQQRAQMRPTSEAVSGSVWNVNAWHWEEKPMTDFSIKWLSRELQGLSLKILSGLAELEFRDVQVTGDASVTVRKGKPIILYLLRVESRWEAAGTAQGLGEAKGSLILPELSSEDGPNSSVIQIETTSDTSRHRLGSAVRKEGIPAVRALLRQFEEALRSTLQKATVEL